MKIFAKLFILLVALSAVPVAITAAFVIWRARAVDRALLAENEETGGRAITASQKALLRESERNHLAVVAERAGRLESFFDDIRRMALLNTFIARSHLANPPEGHVHAAYEADEAAAKLEADPEGSFAREVYRHKEYIVYHLPAGVTPEAARPALDRLAGMASFYSYNEKEFPWVKSSYVATTEGIIAGYPGGHPFPKGFDPRLRPWYTKAVEHGHVTWFGPYPDKDGKDLVLTCAGPVRAYDGSKLLGVAAIDVELTEVLRELFDLGALPVKEALLVDYKGQVHVAASYLDGSLAVHLPGAGGGSADVATFADGRFKGVFEAIRAKDKEDSGIFSPSGELAGDIFTWSRVVRKRGGGGEINWYYVVRTPVEDIVRPALDIRASLSGLAREMAAAVGFQIRSLWLQVLLIVQTVVLLAFAAAYLSARSTTEPLVEMARAVRKVGEGDFNQSVSVSRADEIGEVAAAINQMVKGLKEGDFVKSTFKRFVAARVVEQLIREPERLKLRGEKKELTVCFWDLSGFTPLSEKLEPERLVEIVNEYLGAVTDVIFAHEGTLDKYEGDAIMAFWGAPVDQADHALRACRAALDSLTALRLLSIKLERSGRPSLGMRIGINTGPMVVGTMGSAVRMDYTVMGDAVNLASRLEGANKTYGTRVLVSEPTRRAAGEAIEARELDLLAVKGKTQASRVFELRGLAGAVGGEERAGCRTYERGLAAYRGRRWDEAEALFKEAARRLGGDPASEELLRRLSRLRSEPPPAGWDGTFILAEK